MFYLHIAVVLFLSPTATRGLHSMPRYAKDVSEHCKRREALPSVFLSRRVMNANAQVLHFYKLDIPYSCITTVRTESGHSIIMVLDLYSDESNQDTCKDGHHLEVYDFPETFGGYWGPVPEVVLEQDPGYTPVYAKQYTLATKPMTVTSDSLKNSERTSPSESSPTGSSTAETQSFINIEVPLVNLTASLLPDEKQYETPFDPDEFFDLFYDVTRRPGQQYHTSILPLVQIAVKKQDALREGGDAGGEPRYELEYGVGPFTPDHRLTTPAWSTKINTNRNTNRWKKKKFQDKRIEPKTNNSMHPREPRKFFRKQYSLPTTKHRPSYEHMLPDAITENNYEETEEPFNLIDDIMKSLNESGNLKMQEDSDILTAMNTSENSYTNLSVYLAPYPTFLSVSDFTVNSMKNQSDIPLDGTTDSIWVSTGSSEDLQENHTAIRAVLGYKTSTYMSKYRFEHSDDTPASDPVTKTVNKKESINWPALKLEETTASQITIPREMQKESIKLRATEPVTDAVLIPMTTTDNNSLSGTLVDHESWENVVQSAPVMAGLLNQHGPELSSSPRFKQSVAAALKRQRRLRRKRRISVIDVGMPPQHRPTARAYASSAPSVLNAVDMHEFAQLMELPDDQMNNHMLIKLNPNKSRQLFDMCDEHNWPKSRFLILFNSSRIIISITNFSIPHVMVALTTARPLALLESQCPEDLVECQVEGIRLCIDGENACDGVPNCGSAYAYDEDRVLCGAINQHHNVYLAAVTCLSVLVTMMYVIHYWLKRCVPSVAEAFFVYTDSADNMLYLDPIMRSPMDVGNVDDYCIYNSAFFEDDIMLDSHGTRTHRSIFQYLFSSCLNICLRLFKKQKKTNESLQEQGVRLSLSEEVHRNKNSVTGTAMRSVLSAETIDQEVQTGESLEMAYLKAMNSFKKDKNETQHLWLQQRPPSVRDIELRDFLSGEMISSMDTSTDSPGPSGGSAALAAAGADEEREIQSTFYYPGTGENVRHEILKSSGKRAAQGRKRLRFDEHTTFIPRKDDEEDQDDQHTVEASTSRHKQSATSGPLGPTGKRSQQKLDDNDEHGGGGSDFRKFFRKKKHNK